MTQFTIHEAKTHLSRLIKRALAGEEIIIAKGKKPMVRLVPLPEAQTRRQIGLFPELIEHMSADFDASLDDFDEYMP